MKIRLSLALLAILAAACTPKKPELSQAPKFVQPGAAVVSTTQTAPDAFNPQASLSGVQDTVLFDKNSTTLNNAAKAVLDRQAAALRAGGGNIRLTGHADEQGTRAYDLALGAQRAEATKAYLVSQGVDAARISVTTLGKEQPVAACSDESCWSQNRRVVTSLL